MGVDTRIHWPSPELVAMWSALAAIGARPGRALDLGCGPGTEAMFLASMGWRVVAIDRDPYEIGVLRARRKKLPRKVAARIEAIAGDGIGWREKKPGTFEMVHDRLLLSNLWDTREGEVYRREGSSDTKTRRELIATAAWALRESGLFVLRMRQWSDAVEPFETAGGRDTLGRAELREADRWFERGPELGYLGFATPDGAKRPLKKLSMSIQVWRRNARRAPQKR